MARRHRSSIAVLMIVGLGTGMIRIGDAPVAAASAAVVTADTTEPMDDEASGDTARRFLVVLHQPAPTTTTTLPPTTTTTTTTTPVTASHSPTSHASVASRPPTSAPFTITSAPGAETQQAVVARRDGSRLVVAVPTNYFTLVTDAALAGRLGVPGGLTLVRDSDGRYWATDLAATPAVLYELSGQIAPAAVSKHDDAHDPTTVPTADGHDEHDGTTVPTTDAHAMAPAASHESSHETDAVIDTGAPSDLDANAPIDAACDGLLGPIAPHDVEAACAVAAVPGVRGVRPLGGGVLEVIGDVEAEALEAVPGVERVVEKA